MNVQLRPVASRAVAAIGYDEQAQEVYVRFHGGSTYAYGHVPANVWDALQDTDSVGRFVNVVLKPACPCRRVDVLTRRP